MLLAGCIARKVGGKAEGVGRRPVAAAQRVAGHELLPSGQRRELEELDSSVGVRVDLIHGPQVEVRHRWKCREP